MKKQLLIFITTVVFILVFYNESVGINLSIFGLFLLACVGFNYPEAFNRTNFTLAFISSVLVLVSNAWAFGAETLFFSIISLIIVIALAKYPKFKLYITPVIIPIQGFAALIRLWLEESTPFKISKKINSDQLLTKTLAYIFIPFVFIVGFVIIYALNSDTISVFFSNIKFTVKPQLIFTVLLGFYLAFCFWDSWIYSGILTYLNSQSNRLKQTTDSTQPLFPVETEYRSGIITLNVLNVLLILFLIIYSYEQFILNQTNLSQATHKGVTSIIVSIVMAVGVLLFYFRGNLNFYKSNTLLKKSAYAWMLLNLILIIVTAAKTLQYVNISGLTEQRLGVFWFLVLSSIGLYFTFKKIQSLKTVNYLVNKMSWAAYLGLIVVVVPNWSSIITSYNLKQHTPDFNYLNTLSYNKKQMLDAFKDNPTSWEYKYTYNHIKHKQALTPLSKELYYETIDLNTYPSVDLKDISDYNFF